MASDAPGVAALAALDAALAQRPHADGHLLSEATQRLAAFRDRLIAAPVRDARRLGHVNAVISMVMAAHFPLGPVPWDDVVRARAWLDEAVHAMEPG